MIKTLPLALAATLLIAACSKEAEVEQQLSERLQAINLELTPPKQADDKKIALGRELFFSPDLSIDGTVNCATCHHPDFAGTDGLALPVGVGVGIDDATLISQKRLEALTAHAPDLAEALVPRNSPSVVNTGLYQKRLFWDGRAQFKNQKLEAGLGLNKYNPHNYQQNSLLQAQARMPITSVFEMKGSQYPSLNNRVIEDITVQLLQQNPTWCDKFAHIYRYSQCSRNISLSHITESLAAFQNNLLFINTPFSRYLKGDEKALSLAQKQGALDFYTPISEGGAGCAACHSGGFFTDEGFYNIGIFANGKGANEQGFDYGRYNADKTSPRFRFRTPTLLNAELTGPYFHNGIASTLAEAIAMHTVQQKPAPKNRIALENTDYQAIDAIIMADAKAADEAKFLPKTLSEPRIANLAAFIKSLTDPCLRDKNCMAARFSQPEKPIKTDDALRPKKQPVPIKQSNRKLDASRITKPAIACATKAPNNAAKSELMFQEKPVGLNHKREFGLVRKGFVIDVINYAGVSAVDVNGDCLDDLLFHSPRGGLQFYLQQANGQFVKKPLPIDAPEGTVNPLIFDLDGDYQWDVFLGNLGPKPAMLAFDFLHNNDTVTLQRPAPPVINLSAADINNNGFLDVAFALWRSFNAPRQEHIWLNDGMGNLQSHGEYLKLRYSERDLGYGSHIKRQASPGVGGPDMTFTPNFADIDNDGDVDLLLAADFVRSQVLQNNNASFTDITDKAVINESNGMGAAVADFNRDGLMDWFVSSIKDGRISELLTGHRVYMNQGQGVFSGQVINNGTQWSWGACAKDFNNDGFEDIFYVSGFGEPLATATLEDEDQKKSVRQMFGSLHYYHNSTTPTLLLNDGQGGFVDASKEVGFDKPFDSRGIACFDYQQNGTIDIVAVPLEGAPKLFENQLNNGNNWLAVRLIGPKGNTEAFGAKVVLHQEGGATQYREARFENNFGSRNPAQLHFGLAKASGVISLSITLPGAQKAIVKKGLALNRLHIIDVAMP